MLDDLRVADLSERHGRPVKQADVAERKGQREYEFYPGDDGVAAAAGRARGPEANVEPTGSKARVQARRVGDGYQLNFDNASLAEVTKAILGDTLKVGYFYDPRVQGQVTLSTGGTVTRDELLAILETALRMSNGTLIKSNGGFRIVPAGEAAGETTALDIVRPGEHVPPGYGVSVLPLRHVPADAMLRMLESFLAKPGSLRAEVSGNLLFMRGMSREREALIEVAASFDVDWLRGQSAGIFPLSQTTPDELVGELQQILQTEQGELGSQQIRFQPVHRLNAVLVLTRRSDHIRQVAEWIRRLDRSNAAGQSLYVYRVENGRAADLAAVLNDTLGSGGGSVRRSARTETRPGRETVSIGSRSEPGIEKALGTNRGAATAGAASEPTTRPQISAAVEMAGRRPAEPLAAAGAGQSFDVRIIADEANNTLLIRASPSDYQKILGVLRQLDVPPLQVLINATIAEVTLNDGLRYGVQVFLRGKNVSGGVFNGTELSLSPAFPGLNFILGSTADPKLVLDALSDLTEVKVVSSPSLVVVDNQPAVLKVGDEVPVTTQQATSIENPLAPIVSSIRFRDTGVILKVTPRVNSSGLVTMDVEQEISAIAGQSDTVTLTPTISQRRIASTISVYSGQMVVLGGLISEQTNNDRKSLPGVSHIPIIGDLIGSTQKSAKRTELIVFIKPQVIRNSSDASYVAEEMRSRLRSMAFPAAPTQHWGARTLSTKDPVAR